MEESEKGALFSWNKAEEKSKPKEQTSTQIQASNTVEASQPKDNETTKPPWQAWEETKAERHNRTPGNLPYVNCELCLNRGDIAYVGENGFMRLRRCVCTDKRGLVVLAKKSGAYDLLEEKKFENFTAEQEWQRVLLQGAKEYATSDLTHWFFIGGQSGAGKTHLCTAIMAAVLKRGITARYAMWPQESRQLTTGGFSQYSESEQQIEALGNVPVLYIDDLFKTPDGGMPDKKALELAFEILNIRYNRKLATILSSEHSYLQVKAWNSALAGRIRERCGKFEYAIRSDEEKNWRSREL